MIERVAERGVEVTLTDDARTLLGDLGYDPTYGARPLRRVIQKQLTDRLALALLQGEIREGDRVEVGAHGGELALDKETPEDGRRLRPRCAKRAHRGSGSTGTLSRLCS